MKAPSSTLTVILSLAVLAAPLLGDAQPAGKVYRIGYLSAGAGSLNSPYTEAFRQGLRDLGWVEGQNIVIEYRSAGGEFDRLPALAAELTRLRVDVIVGTPTPGALAAKSATETILIVGVSLTDPVGLGLIPNLARPSGNVTGLSYGVGADIFGKDLELLREAVPKIRRVAVLSNPDGPSQPLTMRNIKAAAGPLGLQLLPVEAREPAEFDAAFAAMGKGSAGALFVVTDPAYIGHRARLVDLAVRNRLPSMFTQKADVEAGGLMSYGPSFQAMYRRAAHYVDKILKGAKPADLPVEQPTKFELVINLKTAKALRLTIPPSLLARADEIVR
jgi:putative tryptophan/tyrosine transport system substrate-binding protein